MTGRSICLLSLHFSALNLYSPLFLYCFSPLASPWKYKFPLECLFEWMLYLFNSYTRLRNLFCFFFISGGYFGKSGRGGGRGGHLFTCQSNVYLQILGSYQTVQTWMGNKCIILINFFFLQKDVPEKTYAFMCVQLLLFL